MTYTLDEKFVRFIELLKATERHYDDGHEYNDTCKGCHEVLAPLNNFDDA